MSCLSLLLVKVLVGQVVPCSIVISFVASYCCYVNHEAFGLSGQWHSLSEEQNASVLNAGVCYGLSCVLSQVTGLDGRISWLLIPERSQQMVLS